MVCTECGSITKRESAKNQKEIALVTAFPTNVEEIKQELQELFVTGKNVRRDCEKSNCKGKTKNCKKELVKEPNHLLAFSLPETWNADLLFSQVPNKIPFEFQSAGKELQFRGAVLGDGGHFVAIAKLEQCFVHHDGMRYQRNNQIIPLDVDAVSARKIQRRTGLNYLLYEVVDTTTDQSRPSSQVYCFDIDLSVDRGRHRCLNCCEFMKKTERCLRMVSLADSRDNVTYTPTFFHLNQDCMHLGLSKCTRIAQEMGRLSFLKKG
jgi:hypothetical protein